MKIRLNGGHIKLYIKGHRKALCLERVLFLIIVLYLIISTLVNLFSSKNEIEPAKNEYIAELDIKPSIKVDVVEEPIINVINKAYRLTSYYTNDSTGSTHKTGSGLTTKSFEINERGWYTYKGKLVIAAATEELLRSNEFPNDKAMHTRIEGRHYFRYYDEIKITIDGIKYDGIILDSCGASMKVKEDRIDLFVSNSYNKIDRGYKGIDMINVSWEVK